MKEKKDRRVGDNAYWWRANNLLSNLCGGDKKVLQQLLIYGPLGWDQREDEMKSQEKNTNNDIINY